MKFLNKSSSGLVNTNTNLNSTLSVHIAQEESRGRQMWCIVTRNAQIFQISVQLGDGKWDIYPSKDSTVVAENER